MSDADKVQSGAAWAEFCDRLKAAGHPVFAAGTPDSAFERAEGTRYLTRLVRCALETFVEFADPARPVLRRTVHESVKMGADNPDNWYENAPVHGDYVYRLRGTRGSVPYLSFGTQVGHYGQGRGMPPAGFLEAKDLQLGPNGEIDIVLSKSDPGASNWLKLADGFGTLVIRQTFLDKQREQRAELTLTRESGPPKPPPLSAEAVAQGLSSAASLVTACAMIFPSWARGFEKHANQLPEFDAKISLMFGGDPNIVYYHSYFRLEPDEALVIEVTPPECEYWNFQLNNYWMESLDYVHHTVSINKATARRSLDGSLRVVVAHEDPGVDNWLDTAGHAQGTMCWRWLRASHNPQPQTKVVKLKELER